MDRGAHRFLHRPGSWRGDAWEADKGRAIVYKLGKLKVEVMSSKFHRTCSTATLNTKKVFFDGENHSHDSLYQKT